MKTYRQVLDAATELAQIGDGMRAIGFGSMMCAKAFRVAVAGNAPVFKLSDYSQPALRPGSVAITGTNYQFVLKDSFSFSEDVPAAGLSVGAGNAEVRIIPKTGWRVRYCQFNPGGPAATGSYFNASYTLKVFASVWGDIIEIWVALGTDASAVITSIASAVVAAIKANADAMRGIAIVDNGAGTGASVAVSSTPATILNARPSISEPIAAGAGVNPQLAFGSMVTSMDGNMVFSLVSGNIDFRGQPMPKIPLDMQYLSSAV